MIHTGIITSFYIDSYHYLSNIFVEINTFKFVKTQSNPSPSTQKIKFKKMVNSK